MNAAVDVLAMLELARAVAERDGLQGDARDYTQAHDALAQMFKDVRAALGILEANGEGDSPLAAFLRAALARVGGAV